MLFMSSTVFIDQLFHLLFSISSDLQATNRQLSPESYHPLFFVMIKLWGDAVYISLHIWQSLMTSVLKKTKANASIVQIKSLIFFFELIQVMDDFLS